MVLLLLAKAATLAVPFTFKWAVDGLGGQAPSGVSGELVAWLIASPIIMTLAYGGMRILMALLTQVRDGLFAKVAMHAVRKLAYSPSSICTNCRCAFIWSARPAA
jgi:hypothetical protein